MSARRDDSPVDVWTRFTKASPLAKRGINCSDADRILVKISVKVGVGSADGRGRGGRSGGGRNI